MGVFWVDLSGKEDKNTKFSPDLVLSRQMAGTVLWQLRDPYMVLEGV